MILIKSFKGYFKSISLLQVLVVFLFIFGIVESFPSPKRSTKLRDSEEWSDVAPNKRHTLDEATKKILARARSVEKPKGYAEVQKKAKEYDKNPQVANEVNELGPAYPIVGARGYLDDKDKLWKHEMYVVLDKKFSREQRQSVVAAIYTLKNAMKCFDFKITTEELPNFVNHVHIRPVNTSTDVSCSSYIGRKGGKQIVVVGDECLNIYGVTMHELMHALGFFHEHVRKDRDKYVKVDWSKLEDPGWASQYQIQNYQKAVKNYDFDSIMHYTFNEAMQPVVNLPEGVVAGQRSHLSVTDLKRLKKAYPCK